MPRLDDSARPPRTPSLGDVARVLAACAAGSACAVLLVAVGVRAKGALSDDGVSVDSGGALASQTRPPVLDAVLRDVLDRLRCDPPDADECEDSGYMQDDCGQLALRTIRQTGTSPCAATCFEPSRGDCEDEEYLATLCGQLEVKRGQVPIHPDCADKSALTVCPPSPSVCRNILFSEGADLQQSESSVLPDAPLTSAVVPSTTAGGPGTSPLERISLASNGYAAPEVTRVVRSVDPDWSDFETTSGGSLYASRVLEVAAAGQPEFPTPSQELIVFARQSQRDDWADNGVAIAECAEYVYEKYYDYTVFEDARVAPGMTPREAWEIAYADNGSDAAIGARGMLAEEQGVPLELRQRDGTLLPLAITFPRGPQPKNEFFSTPIITGALRANILEDFDGESATYRFKLFGAVESDIVLPRPVFGITGFDGIVLLDDDLTARIEGAAPIDEGWTYHYERGVELGADRDEQMLAYEQTRAAFVPLLTRWATLAQEANSMLKSLLPRGEVEVNDQIFDPSIYENVARTSRVTAVSRLSGVRAARDSERAVEGGTPLSENSGLLSSLAPQSFLTGVAFTQLLSPTSGASGSVTAMSGTFGTSLDRVSQGRLLDPATLAALQPAVSEDALFFARLRTVLLQLAVVSGDIEAALLDARDRECLEPTVTPCDWSPRSFLQRVSDQFEAQRERDFQRCMLTTYDYFDYQQLSEVVPGRFLVDFAPGPNKPRTEALQNGVLAPCDDGPYDTSPTRFESWGSCFRAWRRDMLAALATQLAGAEQLVEPETGVVQPSETTGDQQETGDDMFAMDFEYEADWRLTGLPDASDQTRGRWCSLEPQVHGRAEVDGTLLGFDMELADVGIDVDTRPGSGASNEAYVEIGGEEIIAVVSTAGEIDISRYNLIFEETTTNSYELFSFSQTFPVGPVWVNVTAGAAGIFGAHLLGAAGRLAEQGGDCASGDLGLEAKLIPYVGFQGFASASLDYLVVEAGVKISLTLIQLNFPFNVSLTFAGKPQAGNPNGIDTDLKVTNSLDMVLSLLDGRVAAFVEVCFIFCEEFEATLFEWQGLRWVVNLFHTELSLPLGTLVQFQQQLLEDGFTAAGN